MRDSLIRGLRLFSIIAGCAVFLIVLFGLAEIIAEQKHQRALERSRMAVLASEQLQPRPQHVIEPGALVPSAASEPAAVDLSREMAGAVGSTTPSSRQEEWRSPPPDPAAVVLSDSLDPVPPLPPAETPSDEGRDLIAELDTQLASIPPVPVDPMGLAAPIALDDPTKEEGDAAVDIATLLVPPDLPGPLSAELGPQPVAEPAAAAAALPPSEAASRESPSHVASASDGGDITSVGPLPQPEPPVIEEHLEAAGNDRADPALHAAESGTTVAAVKPEEPAPEPVDPAPVRARAAKDLAIDYFAAWSSDRPAESFGRFYDASVEFQGQRLTREQVMRDKQRFMQRWPERTYSLRRGSLGADCSGRRNLCTVRSVYDYKVANRAERRAGRGVQKIELRVSFARGEPAIVYEKSERIQVAKADPPDPTPEARTNLRRPPVPHGARSDESSRARREAPPSTRLDDELRAAVSKGRRSAQDTKGDDWEPAHAAATTAAGAERARQSSRDEETLIIELPPRRMPQFEWEEWLEFP
jgi:hypothetical protein